MRQRPRPIHADPRLFVYLSVVPLASDHRKPVHRICLVKSQYTWRIRCGTNPDAGLAEFGRWQAVLVSDCTQPVLTWEPEDVSFSPCRSLSALKTPTNTRHVAKPFPVISPERSLPEPDHRGPDQKRPEQGSNCRRVASIQSANFTATARVKS
jgi:hypothetical protein